MHLNVTGNSLLQRILSLLLANKKEMVVKAIFYSTQSATSVVCFIFSDTLSSPNKNLSG